jgi:hypothetical protein
VQPPPGAAPPKELFSFWEADARNFRGARTSVKLNDDLKGLEDLAAVRVMASKAWAGHRVSLRLTNAKWSLTEKVATGIEHLSDSSGAKATAQRKAVETPCTIGNGPSIGNCPDELGLVELPLLQ